MYNTRLADLLHAFLLEHGGSASLDELHLQAARRLLPLEQVRRLVAADPRLRLRQEGGQLVVQAHPPVADEPTTLQAELARLLALEPRPRNRALIARYLGWDGQGGASLQQVGASFGLSHERVRQLGAHFLERCAQQRPPTPTLDACLALVSAHLPARAEEVERALVTPRDLLGAPPLPIERLHAIAAQLGRPAGFEVVSRGSARLVVAPEATALPEKVRQVAARLVTHHGAVTIQDVVAATERTLGARLAAPLVAHLLAGEADFHWLDEAGGWFWLTAARRNRLVTRLQKALSVAPAGLAVAALRLAVGRDYRWGEQVPPRPVLLALCRQLEGCRVAGERVHAEQPLRWREALDRAERILVDILERHGGLMRRTELLREGLARGLSDGTCKLYLAASPAITRYATGVYGLPGRRPPLAAVSKLVEQRPGEEA